MKKSISSLFIFLFFFIGVSFHAYADKNYDITFSPSLNDDNRAFYQSCYETAISYMDEKTQIDPSEIYYWLAEISANPKSVPVVYALADENDFPREDAILLGYAVLEQIIGKTRDELPYLYADAWLQIKDNTTGNERRMWKVDVMITFDYYDVKGYEEYVIYIDALTGEVISAVACHI